MPTKLPQRVGVNKMALDNVKIVALNNNQTPVNFMDGLALLFIGLKLTGHLEDWNWVEVLSPLWGPLMVAWFLRLVVSSFFSNNDEDEK